LVITAASRLAVALLVTLLASCTTGSVPARRPADLPSPASRDLEIRIGLVVGAYSADLSGSGPLIVNEPDGSRIAATAAGETWQVKAAPTGLSLAGPSGWRSGPLDAITVVAIDPRAPVRVNGKRYRGQIEVLRDRTGLTVVNRLGMELYLLGVVSAEMGRRSPAEHAALRAQAVVSRTYALRNQGRWRSQGFDLYATVSDQAYGGADAETPEGRAAVSETWGRVLTYNDAPIEAFFFSTCGGRTADGFEVFRGASRPYLRSLSDVAGNGVAYCRISPRYRWREEWTGQSLRASLQRHLPQLAAGSEGTIRIGDIRVTQRSASGRVDQLAIRAGGSEVRVDGHTNIRQALRTPARDLLRSTAFSLVTTRAGENVTSLVAEGMGAGHGVGLCQWGAVGRARAGQRYEQILAAYYPGTRLERRY
jgi:stage II sporulation protein D